MQTSKTFYGTAKAFVDAGLKLNGQMLTQADVSTLGRLGVIKVVGEGDKPARGRTPAMFAAEVNELTKFEQSFGDALPTTMPVKAAPVVQAEAQSTETQTQAVEGATSASV